MYQRLVEEPVAAAARRWDAAPDLERFLTSFYQYFEVRGHRGVVAIHLSHLVALAFTIGLSFVLLFFVDWEALLSCDSEESCRAVSLCYAHPFHQLGLWRLVVLMCFILFSVFWLFNVAAAYHNIRDAGEMSIYYKDSLGITSDEILAGMVWSEVVSRLVEQQKTSPFCIVQHELTALEISNIIMREDNFMIALTNHHAFTSRLPRWLPARLMYTRSVLWNVRTAVFRWLFDPRSRIRREFLSRPDDLARRLRVMGLLNIALAVPILIFVTIYFFMRHAQEFRSHRATPFRRQWTDYAQWTFREFNELPHQFSARMCRAQAMAEAYARSTRASSPVLDAFQRCVKFIAGSILAVLLVVALWDDTPLLFVKIQDKNLLWYLAFFGFLFAVADNAEEGGTHGPPSTSRTVSTPLYMYTAMMQLVKCTHFLPPSWKAPVSLEALAGRHTTGSAQRARLCQHFKRTRGEFLRSFFVHRIQILAEELIGVVLTPVLLVFVMPRAAADIVDVIRRTHHQSPNLGDWCAFGCLDPGPNSSSFYSGLPWEAQPVDTNISSSNCPRVEFDGITAGSCSSGDIPIESNGGKLEKSIVSFILAHRLCWSGGDCLEETIRLGVQSPGHASVFLQRPARVWTAAQSRGNGDNAALPMGRAEVAIPMQDLGVPLPEAGKGQQGTADNSEDTVEWHTADALSEPISELTAKPPGNPLPQHHLPPKVWGFTVSAVRLLQKLEDFQQHEMAVSSPRRDFYSLLPDDLLHLPRIFPELGCAPCDLHDKWLSEDEAVQDSCGGHFFWMEVLHDFRCGDFPPSIASTQLAAGNKLEATQPGWDLLAR